MKNTNKFYWIKDIIGFIGFNIFLFSIAGRMWKEPLEFTWLSIIKLSLNLTIPHVAVFILTSILYSINKFMLGRDTPKFIEKIFVYGFISLLFSGILMVGGLGWFFYFPIKQDGGSIFVDLLFKSLEQISDLFTGKLNLISFCFSFPFTTIVPILPFLVISWLVTGVNICIYANTQIDNFKESRLLAKISFTCLKVSLYITSLLILSVTLVIAIITIFMVIYSVYMLANLVLRGRQIDLHIIIFFVVIPWILASMLILAYSILSRFSISLMSMNFSVLNTSKLFHLLVWKIHFSILLFIYEEISPFTLFSFGFAKTKPDTIRSLLLMQERSSYIIDDVNTSQRLFDFTLSYAKASEKKLELSITNILFISHKIECLKLLAKQLVLAGNISQAEKLYEVSWQIVQEQQINGKWVELISYDSFKEKFSLLVVDSFRFYIRLGQRKKADDLYDQIYSDGINLSSVEFMSIKMAHEFSKRKIIELGQYSDLINDDNLVGLLIYLCRYSNNLSKIKKHQDFNKILVNFTVSNEEIFNHVFRHHKSSFSQFISEVRNIFAVQEKIYSLFQNKNNESILDFEEIIMATAESIEFKIFGTELLFSNPFARENHILIPMILVGDTLESSLEFLEDLTDRAIVDNRSFDLALLHCCKGKVLLDRGEVNNAAILLRQGIDLFEGIRSTIDNDRLSLGFGDGYIKFYDWAIDAAIQMGDVRKAFNYTEHSKARAILDLMCQKTSFLSSDILQERLAELRNLDFSIAIIDSSVYSKPFYFNSLPRKLRNSEKTRFYNEKKLRIEKLNKDRSNILKKIDEIDSAASSLIVFKPLSWDSASEHNDPALTYAELWNNKVVMDNEAVIVFQGLCNTSSDSNRKWSKIIGFCLFFENQILKLSHYQIDNSSIAGDLQLNCQQSIKEVSTSSRSLLNLLHISEYLIRPITSQIPDRIKKLTIMGNDEFQFIPWSTISIGEDPDSMEHSWLVDTFSTRIAPSLSLIFLLKQRENLRRDNIPYQFLIAGASLDPKQIQSYLYWSDYEVESIAKLHNVNHLKDREIDLHFSDEFERSEIIHFSGHANYHGDLSLNALDKTYLCLYEKNLSAAEILNGKLQSTTAKAMILSACLTGKGDLIAAGSEILGLERALFYAGLSSLVTTLWSVDDFATSLLMIKFHSIWKQHNNSLDCLSVSLSTAQVWLRDASWQDLKQEIYNLDYNIEKCIRAYSVLIEYAESKNDCNAINSLTKFRQRYINLTNEYDDCTIPFQHPYYWSAFQVKGIS